MFYKKEENVWFVGTEIILPTNPINTLTESNIVNDYGWIWYDEPPIEYLDWLEDLNVLYQDDLLKNEFNNV